MTNELQIRQENPSPLAWALIALGTAAVGYIGYRVLKPGTAQAATGTTPKNDGDADPGDADADPKVTKILWEQRLVPINKLAQGEIDSPLILFAGLGESGDFQRQRLREIAKTHLAREVVKLYETQTPPNYYFPNGGIVVARIRDGQVHMLDDIEFGPAGEGVDDAINLAMNFAGGLIDLPAKTLTLSEAAMLEPPEEP